MCLKRTKIKSNKYKGKCEIESLMKIRISEKSVKRLSELAHEDASSKWMASLAEQLQSRMYMYSYCYPDSLYSWYAFTINPSDHKGTNKGLTHRINRFNAYKGYVRSIYVFETSASGMLHIHGVIQMKDPCQFKKLFKDTKYHYKIKPFLCNGWLLYMSTDNPKEYYHHTSCDDNKCIKMGV